MLALAVSLALAASPALAQGSGSGGSGYYVTFVARVCPEYTDIFANRARNDIVESLKDLGPDTQYGDSGALIDPVYEDFIAPQTNCQPLPGWQFTLGTGYESRAVTGDWGSLSKVTGAYNTSIVTQDSAPLLDTNASPVADTTVAGATTIELTDDQRAQANNPDQLWAQGGTPTDPVLAQMYPGPEYGFGTLRCATDNLNGDNVEFIYFPAGVRHVFCYAFYVKPPPTTGLITIQKQVIGAPAGTNPSFPFNGDISFDPNGFQLTDGGSIDFWRAGGSTWTVTEGPVDGYSLDSIKCTAVTADGGQGQSTTTTDVSSGTATIALVALEHVTCVYTNRYIPPPGGLTISKVTRGGVGTFSYSVTGDGGIHRASATTTEENVPVDATPALTSLAPGNYVIREHSPTATGGTWRMRSASCNGVKRTAGRPVEVTIQSGEQVTCLFTNVFIPRGSISLAKITEGATGTVNFQVERVSGTPAQFLQTATTTTQGIPADAAPNTPADATDSLRLGSYRIIEQVPASTPAGGWTLVLVECNNVPTPFTQGTIVVALTRSQPALRCVYTNTFSHEAKPEPAPEEPKPLPPEPEPPPGLNPDQPSAPWADLAVTKTASPSVVVTGDVITYRITVTNHGPNDAARVVVDDKPAAAAAVVSVQSSVGTCRVRLPVVCQLGTLEAGAKVTITVRVRAGEQTPSFTNRAVVGSASYDPLLSNNSAHATVKVVGPPPPVGFG